MLSNIIIEHGNGILLDGMISCAINPALVSEISGCQGGIWIYDGSPTIKHMIIKNCTSSYAVCSTGSGTHPTIEHVRIDTIPTYGIYQTNGGDVTMEDSAITGTSSDCIKIMTSTCGLNINNGENDFFPVGIKAIANQSGVDIYATDNHWGVDPVGSELFTYPADVVWSAEDAPQPYNHAPGSSKPAVLSAGNSFVDIYETLKSGNRELALEQYYAMVASNTDLITRKAAIKRIIQVNRDYGLAHDRVLRVIDEELKTPVGWYGANLEYLRAMIDVYDGRYADALEKLDAIANGYAGTPYEAEALSRMAVIYGDCYMDRDAALTYADKAAAVNPGQPELLIAYHAADKHYEPWNHTDVFKEWSGEIAKRPERDEDESVALTSPSVSISPNPANPSTTIHYTIAQPGNVSIAVYSVSGQKVATLVDGFLPAGTHAAVFDGSSLASGVYLYRFEAKGFAKTGKIVLVK